MTSSPSIDAEKLGPCLFCGEKEELYPSYRFLPGTSQMEDKPYAIDCIGCGIDFEPHKGMDVIAAWNRRALPPKEGG